MKALILAGGYARRLSPITDFIAKPLLPLGDRLVVDMVIDKVKELPIDGIYVSTNSYYEKQFRYWASCRDEPIEIIVEPTMGEEEKFGAIAGMKYAMERMGEDDYIIAAGDNIFDFSLSPLYEFFIKFKKPVMAVYDVQSKEKARRYGVVTISENSRVTRMVEKSSDPESTLISTAIYIFPDYIRGLIDEYLSEKNNPDSPGYFMAWLSKHHELYALPFKGMWRDIGSIDEYRQAFREFL